MHTLRIHRLLAGLPLAASFALTPGCGDPCDDDGLGQLGTLCFDSLGEAPELAQGSSGEVPSDGSGGVPGGGSSSGEPADGSSGEPPPGDVPAPDLGGGAVEPDFQVEHLRDADGDGYGTPADRVMADPVAPPLGYVPASMGGDCDDTDADTHIGAAEHENMLACTNDDDGDGWGDYYVTKGIDRGRDCADDNAAAHGCDVTWCADDDGDGYGDLWSCVQGGEVAPIAGYVTKGLDCNDQSSKIHPGAAMAEPWLCTVDVDGDGHGPIAAPHGADMGTDCNDALTWVSPGASELEAIPLSHRCTGDRDGDGFGALDPPAGVTAGTDCDDSDPAVTSC